MPRVHMEVTGKTAAAYCWPGSNITLGQVWLQLMPDITGAVSLVVSAPVV